MKKLVVLAIAVSLLLSCQSGQQENQDSKKDTARSSIENVESLSVNWTFEQKSVNEELVMPYTEITVEINGKKFTILENADGEYYQLDSLQRREWDVPESAISASLGGWAGLFRCIYIEKHDDSLHIKQAWSDAESDVAGWFDTEILKKISISDLK